MKQLTRGLRIRLAASSFVVTALAVCVFLMLNDPDTATKTSIYKFGWLVLFPLAILLAAWARSQFWLVGLSMLAGVFIGVCIMAIMDKSNIWPIAAAFWTVLFFLPIAAGSVAGAMGARVFSTVKRQ